VARPKPAADASSRYHVVDDVTMAVNQYSQDASVDYRVVYTFCIQFLHGPMTASFSAPARYGRDPYACKNQGQRSVNSKDRVETHQLKDGHDGSHTTFSDNALRKS